MTNLAVLEYLALETSTGIVSSTLGNLKRGAGKCCMTGSFA